MSVWEILSSKKGREERGTRNFSKSVSEICTVPDFTDCCSITDLNPEGDPINGNP
jgi:hypothetical protein